MHAKSSINPSSPGQNCDKITDKRNFVKEDVLVFDIVFDYLSVDYLSVIDEKSSLV